uniref:mitogen-activated protein kinase kinase n=1 Tax=Albugo laibachii Nc14 TaxID=890382 RepID=F0WJK7_9STRA|nr:serine/threonine protein kinase putative [Albugo laibachii Nc14]|eukprot:CCA21456.1 serine/threonine protein kinase putative [Albugo laibachii Nc14]
MLRLTHGSPSRRRFNVPYREVDEASAQTFEDGLQLDLRIAEEDVKKSYSVSSSGTFDAAPFRIRQDGLICSPSLVRGHLPGDTESSAGRKLSSVHTIRKQFIKLSVLGRGASGVVHKVIHLPSLMLVAIKDIPVYECAKRHQLITEIKTLYNNLSTLSDESTTKAPRTLAPCPEIVCLYDAFMNPNEGYVSIVVEYMDGGSLQDIVDSGGCKSERVLANIAQCVLRGLSHLHNKHQLHRDIKPSNLLINHFGEVKISDFGIAREMEDSMAKATTFVGTLTYMSPERIASEEYSYKSDVWSLGLSLLTCALGEFPYSSRNGYWELLHKIRNEPPPILPRGSFSVTFRDFMEKCLAKNEVERWNVKQLLDHPFIKQLARTDCHTSNATEYYQTLIEAEAQQPRSKSVNRDDIDVIAESVVESYRKTGKKLIDAKRLSLQDIVAWVEGLPAMQKPKLDRLAHQVGASQQFVHQIFHTKMINMLRSFHHAHNDN